MNPNSTTETPVAAPKKELNLKVFGIGTAGTRVLELLIAGGLPPAAFVAVGTDEQALAASAAAEKIHFEHRLLRNSKPDGESEVGLALSGEQAGKLKSLCEGADVIFIVAGLGGRAGTGISPVLARTAKETGALVLGFVMTPFDCEASHRQGLAQQGLAELILAADGVVCLPNQKVCKLIDDNTRVLDTFKLTNEILADGIRGIWRLLAYSNLIQIHFADVCALLRDQHSESAFATAEAAGATRSREVIDNLLKHPLLDDGQILSQSDAVLVSPIAGPDLTMVEVNRVMEQLTAKCEPARLVMGAGINDEFQERLAVTVIATRKTAGPCGRALAGGAPAEELAAQLLNRAATVRPGSRFVPPAPALPPETVAQILAGQGARGTRGRKTLQSWRQGQLPLEIVSKGRFDKSEPTIHKGEDLDVPTYIRRGIALN